MDSLPVRKRLKHSPPFRADSAFYFVTVCAAERGGNAFVDHAAALLEAARHYHRAGKWFVALCLVMPDHLHMLVHVPPHPSPVVGRAVPSAPQSSGNAISSEYDYGGLGQTALPKYRSSLERVVGEWKRYLSRTAHLRFQRGFFDTRIRDAAHFAEKWQYIVGNPVAKGLVKAPREWLHSIAFDRLTGKERPHRM